MKRWYQSRTMWLNLMSFFVNALTALAAALVAVAPEALALLPGLNLEPMQSFVIIISVNALVNVANMWLRKHSPAAIGTKDDLDAYIDSVDRMQTLDYAPTGDDL